MSKIHEALLGLDARAKPFSRAVSLGPHEAALAAFWSRAENADPDIVAPAYTAMADQFVAVIEAANVVDRQAMECAADAIAAANLGGQLREFRRAMIAASAEIISGAARGDAPFIAIFA